LIHRGFLGPENEISYAIQIAPLAQLSDDALANLVEHRRDLRIRGWDSLNKPRLETLGGAIDKDALQEDKMVMQIQIEAAAEARPWRAGRFVVVVIYPDLKNAASNRQCTLFEIIKASSVPCEKETVQPFLSQ
jgi:hypothetical protein